MKKAYFLALAALLAGLFVYLFYRTEHTVVNELMLRIIPAEDFTSIRQGIRRLIPLTDFAIYSLPEGLWVFSVTITSSSFYLSFGRLRLEGDVFPLLLSVGLEVVQLLHLTHGQFDMMDILASVTGWAVARYVVNYSPPKHNILRSVSASSMACLANYGIVYLSYVMR